MRSRAFVGHASKAITADIPPTTFFHALGFWYAAAQMTGVRRQLDRDKRSVSLWRLLTDIADHPPEKRLGGDRRPSQEHNGLGLLTRRRAGRRDRYLARNGYGAQQIQGPLDRERRDNCAAY